MWWFGSHVYLTLTPWSAGSPPLLCRPCPRPRRWTSPHALLLPGLPPPPAAPSLDGPPRTRPPAPAVAGPSRAAGARAWLRCPGLRPAGGHRRTGPGRRAAARALPPPTPAPGATRGATSCRARCERSTARRVRRGGPAAFTPKPPTRPAHACARMHTHAHACTRTHAPWATRCLTHLSQRQPRAASRHPQQSLREPRGGRQLRVKGADPGAARARRARRAHSATPVGWAEPRCPRAPRPAPRGPRGGGRPVLTAPDGLVRAGFA